MADFPLPTQEHSDFAADEACRTTSATAQWLLEKRPKNPITQGNDLQFFICGQEGFAKIADDIWNAKETVDIICWGFDPAMELERGGEDNNTWPRPGSCYGDMLEKVANMGVKVRLLIWYNSMASRMQNNMPGYTDNDAVLGSRQTGVFRNVSINPMTVSPYASDARQEFCIRWWDDNLPGGKSCAGKNPNLLVAVRDVAKADVDALLATTPSEEDAPGGDEAKLERWFGTHHQKPILIDYNAWGGANAVGYVMGLNSITDFWDTNEHLIDDGRREEWRTTKWYNVLSKNYLADPMEGEHGHEEATEGTKDTDGSAIVGHGQYRYAKPYRDYACRMVGPVLAQLHFNFENAWAAAVGGSMMSVPPEPPSAIPLKDKDNAAYQVQIVRTQAHEREKTIKEVYFQSTSFARNYIYIENQYFFYPEFARHLKAHRKAYCEGWAKCKPLSDLPNLHMFIVIPHPENDNMVPRTADTLTELGHSDAMPQQAQLGDDAKLKQHYADSRPISHQDGKKVETGYVLDRPSVRDLQTSLGLNVSVARLRSSGHDMNDRMGYREIYIHSKLMLIDDVFVTLGSANLNQRSMSGDSEINFAATGPSWAQGLREDVFDNLANGQVNWDGDPKSLPKAFQAWNKAMKKNHDLRQSGKPMQGFLLKFEDHRSTTKIFG